MWHDIRIAARSLLHSRGFAGVVILTLAIAAGMATSVFTLINAVLLRPLPYKDSGRLAVIWSSQPNESRGPVSFDDFEDWRRGSRTLESAAAYQTYYKPVLTGSGDAERLSTLLVSHQYFSVMSARPRLGRFFLPEEDRDGRDDVIVLSDAFWRGKFHADPGVVGRSILLNSRPHVIVGVAGADLLPLPPSMDADAPQIYRPIGEPFGPGSRDGRHLRTIVRLRAGVSIEQAQAELNIRSKQMAREHPDVDGHLAAQIISLRVDMTRNARGALLSLQAAVLVLVLMACANVANLLLARASTRRREIAVREALGAGTSQLVRMLMTESLILGLVGGFCGLVLASWGAAGMTAIAARILPDAGAITVDPQVLLFAFFLSLAASTLFGLTPVIRLRSVRLDDALKAGGRVFGDHSAGVRESLAALQIALALVLLAATGLAGQSFLRLRSVNPGFDPRGVLSASVSLPSARYREDHTVIQFFDRALAGLRGIPGVRRAAMVSVVALSGDFDRTGFQITGKQFGSGEVASPDRYIVSPDYFETLRIPLYQGRLFAVRDDEHHPPVCILSKTAARLWFPGESPLGRRIRAGSASGDFDHSPFREVVGVVGDVAQYGLGLPPTSQIYMPHSQFPSHSMTFMVRSDAEASAPAAAVQRAIRAVDEDQPLYDVRPLEDIVSNTLAARRLGLWLLIAFALGALSLAGAGIYGVVAYAVARRSSEFGIRMALGARPADVIRKAVADSVRMIAAGLAAGLGGSLVVAKLIGGFLFGVRPTDPATLAGVAVLLGFIAVAASYVPARRAAAADPAAALKLD